MQIKEVFHVAAMPPSKPDEKLIRQIAAISSQPDYQIRMAFAGPLPKIIAHFQTNEMATAAVKALGYAEVTAFPITETEIRKPGAIRFTAHALQIEERHIEFRNRDGQSLSLKGSDIFLIVAGNQLGEGRITENTKMKLNLPATLLTGGVQMIKRVTVTGRRQEGEVEQFVRLYDSLSDVPVIEIRQHDFDYSFLGTRMVGTTAGNLQSTQGVLKEFFTGAFFNSTIGQLFSSSPKETTKPDPVEITCRLLYRYYLKISQ